MGGALTGEDGRGKKTRARKNSWPLPLEQNKLDETQSRGLQVFIFQTFRPSLAHSTVLLAQMVTKPVMVQKLHCYREQTKAEVYFLKKIYCEKWVEECIGDVVETMSGSGACPVCSRHLC